METTQTIMPIEAQIQQLKKLAHETKDVRMKLRYDTIRLYLHGRSMKEIAMIVDTTYDSVRNYIRAYQSQGFEGLNITKPPGRARKLTPEQEQQLYDCISTKLPRDVGFSPFVNWTAPLACQWVQKELGVSHSERGMRVVLHRLGLSYTRPTYVLEKADPKKQAEFIEQFEGIKKTDLG